VGDPKLIFKPVFEAFLAGLGELVTPAYRASLLARGVNTAKLLPGYDYAVWEQTVIDAVPLLGALDRATALEDLGQRMVRATIDASPVAKSLMPVLKVLGVTRAVKRSLSRSTSENFNRVTFGAESPNSIEVIMSFVGKIPEFALGTCTGLVVQLGAKNVRGRVLTYENEAATYLLEWG
jgi:uncharacterized protein (TIGR02265 family)